MREPVDKSLLSLDQETKPFGKKTNKQIATPVRNMAGTGVAALFAMTNTSINVPNCSRGG